MPSHPLRKYLAFQAERAERDATREADPARRMDFEMEATRWQVALEHLEPPLALDADTRRALL